MPDHHSMVSKFQNVFSEAQVNSKFGDIHRILQSFFAAFMSSKPSTKDFNKVNMACEELPAQC